MVFCYDSKTEVKFPHRLQFGQYADELGIICNFFRNGNFGSPSKR